MNLRVFLLQCCVGPSEISHVTGVGEGGREVYGWPPFSSQWGIDYHCSLLHSQTRICVATWRKSSEKASGEQLKSGSSSNRSAPRAFPSTPGQKFPCHLFHWTRRPRGWTRSVPQAVGGRDCTLGQCGPADRERTGGGSARLPTCGCFSCERPGQLKSAQFSYALPWDQSFQQS